MTTITFDTLQFVRVLKDSGIPENQAEAITLAFKAAHNEIDLATKQDLALAVKELEVKIASVESNLTRWIIGAGFLQTALIAGLLLKLVK
jgi:hypothetical protein